MVAAGHRQLLAFQKSMAADHGLTATAPDLVVSVVVHPLNKVIYVNTFVDNVYHDKAMRAWMKATGFAHTTAVVAATNTRTINSNI